MGKKKNSLGFYGKTAVGLGKVTVITGVSAAVAGGVAAGTPASAAMPAFGTIASGAGIATTMMIGGGLLKDVKKLNKNKRRFY